jgi:hypothetical protein
VSILVVVQLWPEHLLMMHPATWIGAGTFEAQLWRAHWDDDCIDGFGQSGHLQLGVGDSFGVVSGVDVVGARGVMPRQRVPMAMFMGDFGHNTIKETKGRLELLLHRDHLMLSVT